jgi:hypothetical protein
VPARPSHKNHDRLLLRAEYRSHGAVLVNLRVQFFTVSPCISIHYL